tara:strand:+ start:1091 stop:1837 length:747 start_codon:yes stop_codon:yes gene_type:complete
MGDAGPSLETKPMTEEELAKMQSWTTDDVVEWLKSRNLGMFEKNFREHEIRGDVLPALTMTDLKDMGCVIVGPRTYLVKALQKAKRAARTVQRNQVLWEGEEARYENPMDCCKDYCFSCCMPDPADKYKLTASTLSVSDRVYPYGQCMACCCGKRKEMNNVDLSMITDVDSSEAAACCCGRDIIFVKVQGETPNMMPTPENPNKPKGLIERADIVNMYIERGKGPEVCKMIRDAIEEAQDNQKVSGLL